MDVNVGDKVQIVNGGIDVTNGNRAKAGRYYGEGGPLWATVELIDPNWKTGSRYGLPGVVTKVRCSNNGVVVWQVQPQHIAPNVIRGGQTSHAPAQPEARPNVTYSGAEDLNTGQRFRGSQNLYVSNNAYAPKSGAEVWTESGGITTRSNTSGILPSTAEVDTKIHSGRNVMDVNEDITYINSTGGWRDLNSRERKSIGGADIKVDQSALNGSMTRTSWQNADKKRQMLNEDIENITNPSGFPVKSQNSDGLIAAKYDYRIIPGDQRYTKTMLLEDKLKSVRAAFGIPVHGNNMIAKAMKLYMYNRFKTPDRNLAHNKTVTHVFFTRPDLNILKFNGGANAQTLNHTEAAMVWRRHPELFKLLTQYDRCGDDNNFNLLLSNQVTSFDIQDETLTTVRAGKSWNEYEMMYGDSYSGRTAGEFTCNFTETSDYSVFNLIKLWITYIDNVGRGAWNPSYNLRNGVRTIDSSHIFTKSLDYAASAYVFKCGPDGEDILYWTKYYGVFPLNTGAGALQWDIGTPIGDTPKLNIRFGYSCKRDMNPISLIEFNNAANIKDQSDATSENSFNVNYGHSSRPYVGCPFIEMKLGNTELQHNGLNYMRNRTEIRLKFQKSSSSNLNDDLLYRYNLGDRNIIYSGAY